jgi:hypothetical protein
MPTSIAVWMASEIPLLNRRNILAIPIRTAPASSVSMTRGKATVDCTNVRRMIPNGRNFKYMVRDTETARLINDATSLSFHLYLKISLFDIYVLRHCSIAYHCSSFFLFARVFFLLTKTILLYTQFVLNRAIVLLDRCCTQDKLSLFVVREEKICRSMFNRIRDSHYKMEC